MPPQPTAMDDFGRDPVDMEDIERQIMRAEADAYVRQNYNVVGGKLVRVPRRR